MDTETDPHIGFTEMLQQYKGTLMGVCLYYAREEDIDDLYQEMACALWEAWQRYKKKSSLRTWVTSVAVNVAMNYTRDKEKQPRMVPIDPAIAEMLADEATDLRYQRLYRLVDMLKEEDDRKLMLLYLDRYSLREIAELMNISEGAAKTRLFRIREKLKELRAKYNDDL